MVWRRPLLYHRPGVYLAIAVANLGLRFFWTLSLIPEGGEEAWQKTIQVAGRSESISFLIFFFFFHGGGGGFNNARSGRTS